MKVLLGVVVYLVAATLVVKVTGQVNPYADCCDNYCYREDENPYLFLATKTSYEFVYGKASNQHIVPHCKALQFWSFNRHGARLPSREDIMKLQQLQKIRDEIVKNYDNRGSYPESGRLCDKDLEGFRRWQWNYSITEHAANSLTDQGKDDTRYMARRWQTRYPDLLRQQYSDQAYKFLYTDTERTRATFEAFAEGLFGSESYKVHGISAPNDTVIQGYAYCRAWNERIDDPNFRNSFNRFLEMDDYRRLVAHVSRRLGFRYTLNESLIESMYDMCRFDKAWQVNRPSAWCAAFTKDQIKLMEDVNDLRYYFKTGYGLYMNPKLGCLPMRDMLNRFQKIVEGDRSQPRAVVYFTHSAALQQLLTALGVNKDSLPLTAENMREQKRRQWRTSLISPFSANLVAVLYECSREERHRVMFFLNERPVDYPGCSVGLCSWDFIRQQLADSAENCDLEFCNESSSSSLTASVALLLTALLAAIFKL